MDNTNTQDNGGAKLVEDMAKIIFNQYKEYQAKGDYSVTNRGVPMSFAKIFKDASAAYAENVFLCERFFKGEGCKDSTRSFYDATDEQQELYNEFVEFANNEQIKDQMDPESYQAMIQDYTAKLEAAAPVLKDIPVKIYVMDGDQEIVVHSLNEATDQAFDILSIRTASMIISMFHTMNFFMDSQYKVDMMPVEYPNYIDIVAQITVA